MVPHFREMVALGREILRALVDAHGPPETVKRFSNPYWLSALSCVLGFEWGTSGQTTVTLRALKIALRDSEIPVRIIGGKGEEMRWVSYEASRELRRIGLENIDELTWASKFSCSVDDSALQDSYRVYFHSLIVDEERTWAVVNQGMNLEDRTARRYHWSCDRKISVEKPHASIFADKDQDFVLDLTSPRSSTTRKTMIEILGDSPPSRLKEDLAKAKMILRGQGLLDREIPLGLADRPPDHLAPPKQLRRGDLKEGKGSAGLRRSSDHTRDGSGNYQGACIHLLSNLWLRSIMERPGQIRLRPRDEGRKTLPS